MDLLSAFYALFTDPTYGVPMTVAVALTVFLGWWSWRRVAPLPSLSLEAAPESWRLQLDALVYSNLSRGRYTSAVDGLGRCLNYAVREHFKIQLSEQARLDDPEANRLLAPPITLRSLVRDLNRAYTSATWAEQPSWLADRVAWVKRRQQRRAARDFAVLTHRVTLALTAFEGA